MSLPDAAQDSLVFSPQYTFVRGRQLEGTFPGDRYTGIWPVTAMRVGHGWSRVPEEFWPYDTSIWPPVEPAGLDVIARKYRINTCYRRVRTVRECRSVLLHVPVIAAVKITDDWYQAEEGRIPRFQQAHISTTSHSVLLVGYDDRKSEFRFQNSWGNEWGDRGFGYLPYSVFRETCIESWAERFQGNRNWTKPKVGAAHRSWGIRDVASGILHGYEISGPREERIAWAYAVERDGGLEVEELFVMPQFRQRKYGKNLAKAMGTLANQKGGPLKFWISHADAAPENLAVIEKTLRSLSLQVENSKEAWASYLYCRQKSWRAMVPLRRPTLTSCRTTTCD